MEERPFMDKNQMPEDTTLQAVLGNRFSDYQQLSGLAAAYSQVWSFSKSSGWMLKVFDRQKALFYLIPLNYAIRISMAIREKEREVLLEDKGLSALHEKISTAKKYVEGFALKLDILSDSDLPILVKFLTKLIAIR